MASGPVTQDVTVIGVNDFCGNLLPTIKALSAPGMGVNVVGNHEFDNGVQELTRFQGSGCDTKTPE